MSLPIPVLVPRLPSVEDLLPFLRRIDNTHIYSNYGPLWREFKSGLTAYLGSKTGQNNVGVTLTSSGTAALELALRYRAVSEARYCLLPAYTFIATAHAVVNAHFEPFFTDVDGHSLALTPQIAIEALRQMPERPGAVVVVSPFGGPPDVEGWESFELEHKIPVVFDAAAALTGITRVGRQPLCCSLHATKVFGIGEGGAILTTDQALTDQAMAMTGFGFFGSARLSEVRGGNYRISEYTAAMGLAMLSAIDRRVEKLRCVSKAYLDRFAELDLLTQEGCGTDWVTMTFNIILPERRLEQTLAQFDREQIQWRRWWGLGCHKHPAFASCSRTALPVTANLAPRVVGIPFFDDITLNQIDSVCAVLELSLG
jgi:dTDP-4-amino-4,6-dideoxygalactose transaminase